MLALQQSLPVVDVVADPVSAVLVLFGAVFVGAAMLALGYLAAGAAVRLFMPTRPARTHGR